MRKKLLSLALALVMVVALVPSAFAAESGVSRLTDIPANAWYMDEITYAVEHGYISGTSANTFSPDAQVTRAQFVTILGRMLNVDTSLYTSSKFDDVDASSWYGPYVAWAADKGYVNGISVKEFAPNNNLTFEQMGTIMSNYISKSGVVLTPSSTFSGYADEASISRWAQTSMEVMAKYDLLPVNEAGNVRPTSPVIRSEAAVALVRLAKGDGKGGKPISNDTSQTVVTGDVDEVMAKVQSIHDELWASGKITSSMTEKEKAIEYFRWMCINTGYGCRSAENPDVDIDWHELSGMEMPWEAHSSYGPLILGKGVCDGLAKAYTKLLESDGIYSYVMFSEEHAWNIVTLDGVKYEIDLTEGVSCTKNANGSLNEVSFNTNVQQQFYPEEYEKQFEGGFGGPLSEAELQQMLEDMQAEYNASWGQ